jgi:hypothetical protein
MRNPLFSAQAHVNLALAQAAFPRKQTKQWQDGALKHALARQASKLLMTTTGAQPHGIPQRHEKKGELSNSNGRIP